MDSQQCATRRGRLFILGVGGGAGHASHAVNDFRKLCGIESYAPSDNVSELTARTNDDGWDTSYSAWLEARGFATRDALLVFSVGGGSREHNVSVNLVSAIELAQSVGAAIYGVVGEPGRHRSPSSRTSPWSSSRRRPPDAARRVVPGGRLARARLASRPRRQGRATGSRSPSAVSRAVFVDRDGVVNDLVPDPLSGLPESPLDPDDVVLLPGAPPALGGSRRGLRARRRLEPAGGSEGGRRRSSELDAVQARVRRAPARQGVTFDRFTLCFHHPAGVVAGARRHVRLPEAGTGDAARRRRELGLDLARIWLVGDTDADVARRRAAGAGRSWSRIPAAPTGARQRVPPIARAATCRGRRLILRPATR